MNERARILFVAGESGAGKTSACLAFQIYGPLLLADIISEKAGPQYFGDINECFARWLLWTPEMERPDNQVRLEKAFHEATLNVLSVVDEKLTDTIDLTIEGAITGHPPFRAMMLRMLQREFQIPCSDADVQVFWLAPPPSTIHEYVQRRGRPADAHVTLRDVEQRAARYAAMMDGQSVQRFDSPAELKKAGIALFKKGQRILTMTTENFQIRQLADELQPPESGKQSIVLADDANTKVVLFAFAAGDGLAEHVAPLAAIIQVIKGEASLTVGEETVVGKPGTWIEMAAKTPHSIKAQTPMVMSLTLFK
jgi:quercetin dioxygenase-like cupin family protein